MRKKLILIGAGSAMFTQGLVSDLIRYAKRNGTKWHLGLVDPDPRAFDSIHKLSAKMIAAKEADIELSFSTERADILPGADYIAATVGVGGRRAWEQDVFIPRKYGIFQPVGDTAMPGGISRAMRMVPAMVDIARDAAKLCPDAFFFNYSNPMTVICRAISKATGTRAVGLCHGVHDSERHLAAFAGLDPARLTSYAVGVNHLTFLFDIRYDGKDARPILLEKYRELKREELENQNIGSSFAEMGGMPSTIGDPFAWELFERFNAYPAPGDRHITEFFPERFPQGQYYGKVLGKDAYSFENVIEWGDSIYERMDRLGQSPDPLPAEFFANEAGEHEQLIDIIDSIEHDGRRVYSANMTNNGSVPNLPGHAVLEMPCVATARGFMPMQTTDFPDTLAQLTAKPIAIAELTVDAALQGDRRLFEEAVLLGGYLTDRVQVERMVDELIAAHIAHLPQFQ
ncbi:family 4 glycosyl hydrolase [Paenibacillus spongiae]|uniref:Glycosyl hydrolase family 4 C-terminal domain-containing protein n=1 Tax=Paenibacillus spongiae TaxID=2909671 RepID=A0ABY5SKV2_9BACL|nr:hypothetical protein [Paenibacillus spongiae]UVI33312.1 hypothetical protein L1F29_16345 [Paenibacillus spongiae]